MERNYAEELDAIKEQLQHMQEALAQLTPALEQLTRPVAEALPHMLEELPLAEGARDGAHPTVGHVEKLSGMHPDPHIAALMSQLEDGCGESGSTGRITYMGVFASGGRQSNWVKNGLSTDGLLALIENRTTENVLACVGSSERLSLLLALLRKPRTVAELVSECGFSSTGQVYHHLKPLIAADLMTQDRRGSYVIQPHRVQGLIMLLAGVNDLIDPTYSTGELGH